MDDKIKMNDKFILMNMEDERTKKVAEVMGNATCKKIIDFLADTKEASEKDISDSLGVPLNTIEYNLKKLIESGLVEKTKNFFWSVKGRRIEMFKLANKYIIISPKKKRPDMKALKTLLPIFIIAFAVLAVVILFSGDKPVVDDLQLKQFASLDDLKDFVNQSYESRGYSGAEDMMVKANIGAPMATAGSADLEGASEFSTTNIQVEGVDEADIIKNDGKYIYAVSGNKVVIINAYPAENMKILSEIDVNKSVSEIFINGDKLIVFAQGYEYIPYTETRCLAMYEYDYGKGGCGGDYNSESLVYIYDVSDRENPELEKEISVEGDYYDSRMINDYVYVISTKYANIENPQPPIYAVNGVETKVAAEDVYYWGYPDSSYYFTSISAINLESNEFNNEVYLTGYSGVIFVSQDNIYLTHTKTIRIDDYYNEMIEETVLPLLPDSESQQVQTILSSDSDYYTKMERIGEITELYSNKLDKEAREGFQDALEQRAEDFALELAKRTEKTVIHKINIDKEKITYKGVGEVPGHLLNQFSMDEYNGNFRITTTTGEVWGGNSLNHLYVLDENLEIIGKVEDLAQGERIYSTRFLGDRAYVVTFKKVDPLFVIDLSNPEKPEVLGYLKITGFSDYLHIYDENHIIGIGKETQGGNEQFSWYQGLKISLFDVSDVENPVEKAKIVIGDRGTDSLALQEHKAFLFDKEKGILVIPVSLAEIDRDKYKVCNEEELASYDRYTYCLTDSTYGEIVWEGAYVLDINTEEISVRGKITHSEEYEPEYGPAEDEAIGATRGEINGQTWTKTGANKWKTSPVDYHYGYDYDFSLTDEIMDSQEGGIDYNQYMYDWKYQIQRSLYMNNVLYTLSQAKIKANNLETIGEINNVNLPYEGNDYPYYDSMI